MILFGTLLILDIVETEGLLWEEKDKGVAFEFKLREGISCWNVGEAKEMEGGTGGEVAEEKEEEDVEMEEDLSWCLRYLFSSLRELISCMSLRTMPSCSFSIESKTFAVGESSGRTVSDMVGKRKIEGAGERKKIVATGRSNTFSGNLAFPCLCVSVRHCFCLCLSIPPAPQLSPLSSVKSEPRSSPLIANNAKRGHMCRTRPETANPPQNAKPKTKQPATALATISSPHGSTVSILDNHFIILPCITLHYTALPPAPLHTHVLHHQNTGPSAYLAHRLQPPLGLSVDLRAAQRRGHLRSLRLLAAHHLRPHPPLDRRRPVSGRRRSRQRGPRRGALTRADHRHAGGVASARRAGRLGRLPALRPQRVARLRRRPLRLGGHRGGALLLLRLPPHGRRRRPCVAPVGPLQLLPRALPSGYLFRMCHDLWRCPDCSGSRQRPLRPLPLPLPPLLHPRVDRPFLSHAHPKEKIHEICFTTKKCEKDSMNEGSGKSACFRPFFIYIVYIYRFI